VQTVETSPELLAPLTADLELCYQTFGDAEADPLLLVMGLGGPMTWWDTGLCEQLARAGFYVIRYDNRDTGRSSRARGKVRPHTLLRALVGGKPRAAYSIADLARDAFGLLDHLGISAAHLAGVSMGGMIAQTMAMTEPDRVLSLTSIMSTTGNRGVGRPHPALIPILLAPRGPGRDSYIAGALKVWRNIGSPGYPQTEAQLTKRAGDTFDRGVSPDGVLRQMLAVLNQRDRTAALAGLRMPVTVVHGLADKMVNVSGGRATAAAIPGAEILLIADMGHDLPAELYGSFTNAIRRTADRAPAQDDTAP
jgi:pimeloyl-ACP methyl ester carboxylesterase